MQENQFEKFAAQFIQEFYKEPPESKELLFRMIFALSNK